MIAFSSQRNSTMILLLITYSLIISIGSGILEMTAYRNIVENSQNHGNLYLSLYLVVSSLAQAWFFNY